MLSRLDRLPLDLLAPPFRRERDGEAGTVIYSGIARVEGVQPYPEQGDGYAELMSVEAIDAFVSAAPGLPVLMGEQALGALLHPGQARGEVVQIGPENWRAYQVGTVIAAERIQLPDSRAAARVQMAIQDAAAIDLIDGGGLGLSPDYRLPPEGLRKEAGVFRGQRYSAVQTGGIFNNLCIVDSPRGGDACMIRHDAAPSGSGARMPTIADMDAAAFGELLNGALKPLMDAISALKAAEVADAAPVDGDMAKKLDAAEKRADAAEKALLDRARAEKAQRLDAALTAQRIDRPAGFDPGAPTDEGLAAANDALIAGASRRDRYAPDQRLDAAPVTTYYSHSAGV